MTEDPARGAADAPPPSPPSASAPSTPPSVPAAARPAPARPGPARPGGSSRPDHGGRSAPAGPGVRDGEGGPGRPTPVRDALGAAAREPLRPLELPHRTIRVADGDWVVREGGLAGSGTGSGPRAPLLLLLFARAAESDRVTRELLVPARRLADLSDDALIAALGAARPFREDRERREIFPDTRKRGAKGL